MNFHPLIQHIKDNDTEYIKTMIAVRANLNLVYDYGWTPLHAAVYFNRGEIVQRLIDAGVYLDQQIEDVRDWNRGCTALNLAAKYGYADIVLMLLYAGADVTVGDQYGWQPINWAMVCKKDFILQYVLWKSLLLRGIVLEHKPCHSIDRFDTALYTMLQQRRRDVLRDLLVSNKKLVHAKDRYGATLLMYAAVLGLYPVVDLLCRYGADPLAKDRQGRTLFDLIVTCVDQGKITQEQFINYQTVVKMGCSYIGLLPQLACKKLLGGSMPQEIIRYHIMPLLISSLASGHRFLAKRVTK